MRVLIACEFSGRVREAFRAHGHDAWSNDLLPAEDGSPHHYWCDVRKVLHLGWDLMIAHPTCTRMANSGVRWMRGGRNKKRMAQMMADVEFYVTLWNAPIARVCLENPVMHKYAKKGLARLAGPLPKRQFVQPWQFGEPMFKSTGYLTRGLPKLIHTNVLKPPKKGTKKYKDWSWVHRATPGPNRWKIRSRTPSAIARAMAAQWGRDQDIKALDPLLR